jgi:hypothetical protein
VEEEDIDHGEGSFAWISAVTTARESAASSGDEIISIGEDLGIRELRLDDEPLERVAQTGPADEDIPDLEDFEAATDNLVINDPVHLSGPSIGSLYSSNV